jgi:hypothetical protein
LDFQAARCPRSWAVFLWRKQTLWLNTGLLSPTAGVIFEL